MEIRDLIFTLPNIIGDVLSRRLTLFINIVISSTEAKTYLDFNYAVNHIILNPTNCPKVVNI